MKTYKATHWLLAILFVISLVISSLCVFDTSVNATSLGFAGGNGTEADPYLIETKEHLNNVRNNLSAHYKMIADIVFTEADFTAGGKYYNSGRAWSPIGFTEYESFTGTFDGNGHFVSGLVLSRYNATCYAGLFGCCDGTIKNVGITNSTITIYAKSSYEYVYAGSIAGYIGSGSSITNCWSDSDVFAYTLESNSYSRAYAGGIVGMAECTAAISSCYNIGTVRADAPGYASSAFAGGITAGLGDGGTVDDSHISNCFNADAVTGDGYTGGIVGYMWQGTVEKCYNVGSIDGENVGGITGYAVTKAIVNNNFYLSSVSIAVGNNTNNGTNKPCTSQQMASQATYADFDFITTWEFVENNHYVYPTLISNPYFDSGFKSGSGTIDDPYLIETKEHLSNVRNNLGAHYRLVADIEFAEVDFTANGSFYNDGSGFIPIGSKDEAFCGSFDGNGYSISNLLIYNSSTSGDAYAGLFAINNGVVKNLGIENGNISVYPDSNQYAYCGSIAGKNLGTISDCYSTGSVWSRRYAGGIAGYNSGTITGCYNNGAITASKDFDLSAGGIVGYNYDGIISNCYNNGQILSSAIVDSTFLTTYYAFAGGIIGYGYDGTVEKCYNTGNIDATSNITSGSGYASANAGGIVGSNRSCNISQCYNIGAIVSSTTDKAYTGGIAGSNASSIANCYNVGTLATASSKGNNYLGGIAGNNTGSINTSYNVADAIENIASSNSGTINNCYFHSETLSAGCKLASLFSVLTYQGFNFDGVWQMSDGDYPLPVLRSVKNYASFEYSPEENTVDFASGKGTEADPFIIKTITHLDNIRKYPSSYFVFGNDITFEQENEAFVAGWKPFAFKGYLDGKGYKITGIRITVSNTLEYQWRDPGLFSSNDGTIKNITVEDMRISVSNMGDEYGGFICAVNNGEIINCHSERCMIVLQNIYHFFGGIAGNNSGSIQNCTSNNTFNWGAIGGRIGGIAANNTGSIIGCTNNSTITNIGSYTPISGGISAQNSGNIIGSNNLAPINTKSTYSQRSGYSGGIVGQMTGGKISQCYNLGAISTEATEYKANTYSGGIVAYISNGNILDCYNTGDIYGEPNSSSASCCVGGIIGYNNSIGTLKNCYSIGGNSGRASSSNLYVGYICGYNASNSIENCYYLGIVSNGSGAGDYSTMYGKSVAALKDQNTYAGFDFNSIWTTSGNSDYPFPELGATSMVYEKEVKSIQMESMPTKLTYIENYESLSVVGGTIKVAYAYDEYDVISLSDVSVSGFDNSVVGKQRITVSYMGCTTEFEVEIVKKSLERIEITTLPNKLVYTEGDLFDGTGMVITAYYNNDTSNMISGYTVNGYSPTPGTKTITVSFDNKSVSFTVVVYSTCEVKGHIYADATCLAPETCSVCGITKGAPLGHRFANYQSNNDASCTVDGTETSKCDRCNETHTRTADGSAKGHSYTKKVTKPTCTANGYTTYTCSCGDTYKADHVNALGHSYDSGKVTKAATCKATGVKTYTCKTCKATKTATIAKATKHTYSNNCDTTCNVCSAKRTAPHTYSNSCDTSCNSCKAKRTIKHTYSNSCDTKCNVCKKTRKITHTYKTVTTKATLTKNGKTVKQCSVCGKVSSTKTIKYVKTIKISATSYKYDGKVKTPSVTVKDSGGKSLKKGTDYTVTYSSGRKNVGTYTVTIKLKGNYTGTKVLTFKVCPAKASISKLTAGKGSITVTWKKVSAITGYEIQYSTSKSFSGAKTVIATNNATSFAIGKLSAKKKYYARIRTYKIVDGVKVYSDWSSSKNIKTK